MRTSIVALAAIFLLAATPQSPIVGTWEGVMNGPNGPTRRIMNVTSSTAGTYDVVIHSLDETDVPIVTKNVFIHGNVVTMRFDMNTAPWTDYHRVYDATLARDGATLDGKWRTDQFGTIVMNFTKVARATWTVIVPRVRYVEVQPHVTIEALDWGGTGRPLLWLAGLGNTGHDFYGIVPELTKHYHVYSMTRRGFGASSSPPATIENYGSDRLGDDVIAVMDALKIQKPIVMGHSIAGDELSDLGTRFPNRVSALIYVDAAYWYGFDSGNRPKDPVETPPPGAPPLPPVGQAIIRGARSFKGPIDVPVLALFANPHDVSADNPAARTPQAIKAFNDETNAAINGLRRDLPRATVIVIPNANHFMFVSNKRQFLDDVNTWISKLPPPVSS